MSRRRNSKPNRRKQLPRLRPEFLDDREAFANVVDKAAVTTPGYRRRGKQILRLDDELREIVSDRAWKMLLRLERLVNERHADVVDRLVRWAFREGERAERERRIDSD